MLTESSPTIDQETLTGIVLFVWQTLLATPTINRARPLVRIGGTMGTTR